MTTLASGSLLGLWLPLAWLGDELLAVGVMSGALVDCEETCNSVPRAELMALVRALEVLSWHDGPIHVAFDASYVQTTWNKVSQNKRVGNPNGDLKMRLKSLDRRSVELFKVKSHMALEDHINLGRPAWSWHANAAADSLAGEAAVAVAPYGKDKVNSFILGRAWRLNRWLLPRVKFWLRQQNAVKPPKKQSPGCTKDAFLLSIRENLAGGHEWDSTTKGLRCGIKLPKYKSLSDLEVIAQIPCDGIKHVRGVHHTHSMNGGARQTCDVCKGVCFVGRPLSKKLRQPCGSSGRVLYRRR